MKRDVRELLKNKPNATLEDLSAKEVMLVIKTISNQKAGFEVDWEMYHVYSFTKGLMTVNDAIGYLVSTNQF